MGKESEREGERERKTEGEREEDGEGSFRYKKVKVKVALLSISCMSDIQGINKNVSHSPKLQDTTKFLRHKHLRTVSYIYHVKHKVAFINPALSVADR